jgi:hypothetical protein
MNENKTPCASGGTGHTATGSGSGALVSVFSISNYRQIPIRVNGRAVGEVRGMLFTKHLRASKHFLRTPPAIAFDVQSLRDAENAGAQIACVIDDETGRGFVAAIAKIRARGFRVNRGHGEQIALMLDEWRTDDFVPMDELIAEATQ